MTARRRAAPALLFSVLLAPFSPCQEPPAEAGNPRQEILPRTAAERSGYRATTRYEEAAAFLSGLSGLSHGDRVTRIEGKGKSTEGRELLVARASLVEPPPDALRILVTANIHAGEVEGKEALLVLLREIATGEHEDVLRGAVLWLLPIYNADGNEKIDPLNRVEQNGPDQGVGRRENGAGLDLNRDAIKAEAEETKALLALFSEVDPDLYMDLHTTNGSYHGYHLTYAPSLSTNVDPGVADLSRSLLDDVAKAMAGQRFSVFDYGNFETRGVNDVGAGQAPSGVRGWWTYDHRARYVTNCFGLRNRISVLSESYSYCDFETRIAVTRAFVLAVARTAIRRAEELRKAFDLADRRLTSMSEPIWFGSDTSYAAPERMDVLVGEVDDIDVPGTPRKRHARRDVQRREPMPVFRAFRSRKQTRLPDAWAVPPPPQAVLANLRAHGVSFELLAEPAARRVLRFSVTDRKQGRRPYQGHREVRLIGSWSEPEEATLPAGTAIVPSRQRLGRLAAQLLSPESEDSLITWEILPQQGSSAPVLAILGN